VVLAGLVLFGLGWVLTSAPAAGPSSAPRSASRDLALRQTPTVLAIQRVRDAVVNIHSERIAQGPLPEELFALSPSQNRINGMGTGILIDPRGYIVTNQHVVEDVNRISVRLSNRSEYRADVLAKDTETDLALLKIQTPHPLPVMPLGTARDLMVGESVIAIGNAYGYDHTVTTGVVSALGRDVTLNKEVSYKSLIQTDASINPGNSGGPLINIHGELVGVNVAIRAGAQGIGFAIPVDTMMRVTSGMFRLQALSRTRSPFLGLAVRDEVYVPRQDDRPLREAIVERVENGGPASKAGLRIGDALVQAGDQPVSCSLDLERALMDRQGGERLTLLVRRGGAEQRLEIALEAGRSPAAAIDTAPRTDRVTSLASDPVWRKLGVRVQAIGSEHVTRSHPNLHGGLLITEVRPESPAGRAGFQRGDLLIGLHLWEMLTVENVQYVLSHPDLPSLSPVKFYLLRNGQVHKGVLYGLD
jgi:serine protease Do